MARLCARILQMGSRGPLLHRHRQVVNDAPEFIWNALQRFLDQFFKTLTRNACRRISHNAPRSVPAHIVSQVAAGGIYPFRLGSGTRLTVHAFRVVVYYCLIGSPRSQDGASQLFSRYTAMLRSVPENYALHRTVPSNTAG